jgi:hypothetical protein
MSINKLRLWESHSIILPEARGIAARECGDCRFFVTIQGVSETRQGCVVDVQTKYRSLLVRVPSVIYVIELLRSEGKDGLGGILGKGNPEAQACEMWLPR